MPFAVIVAAIITVFPDQYTRKLSWIMSIPFLILSLMFLTDYDINKLVAYYGGEQLPLRYRFAATWAAREGPILLWVAWMALLATIWSKPFQNESKESTTMRLRLMNGFSLTLLLISWSMKPFELSDGSRGAGLNNLLQTDLMVIHPPLIFLAYSFCITLAVTGLAALLTDTEGLKNRLITIGRPAFFFATLGIGLGGLWAYLILDWGGYWAWDPVETGSMLPWIAIIVLLHLRTRPGKTDDSVWAAVAMAAGALAIFATMITRAGGVWAVSVHTFVVSNSGTVPNDVFGRLMILRQDMSGVEVLIYLMAIIQLMSFYLASRFQTSFSRKWLVTLPLIALLGLISGGDVLDGFPPILFVLIGLGPMIEAGIRRFKNGFDWKWLSLPAVMVGLYFFHGMFLFQLISSLFAFGLILSDQRMKAWGWASAGITLFLAASWSGMFEMWVSAIGMAAFASPWLLVKDEDEFKFAFKERSFQQRLALWIPVVVVGLYLILTLVILISSIDAIQLSAHELYGAPFIILVLLGLSAWSMRAHPERVKWLFFLPIALIPISWLLVNQLGYDSRDILGASISRGQIVIVILIPALLAIPATLDLIKQSSKKKGIPMWAHVIHLGLVLLIIGHVLSTTLIDRGTYEHSVTLVMDEKVEWGGYEFEFVEVVTQTENLEVGDGYLGAIINIYEDGELIDTVEPGVLRFGATARSEVDRVTMAHGDLVIIMDGTQARSLMEGSDLVRVMVYDLPGIHLVWAGWALILIGSLAIWRPKSRPLDS
jgi:cytochrome c biogenesis factor